MSMKLISSLIPSLLGYAISMIYFLKMMFDCIIVQNVLEHALNPTLCVENMHRVLRPGGYFYSENPFIQQVHAGKYQYMRFTKRVHINVYRNFKLLETGSLAGPATFLVWSIESFLLSLSILGVSVKKYTITASRFLFFPIKYFDYFWRNDPSRSTGAFSTFCLVQKTDKPLSMMDFMKIEP